jgi:hypothetical protein
MVLVKNLTQTQINSITTNLRGEVVTNADTNKLMYNNGTNFTYLVYSDLNGAISGLSAISATNLTGTLQTAAQPNVTSLGTLTGLISNGVVNVASHDGGTTGLQLGGVLVTATAPQLNYTNTTPGTAEAGKALVTDSNNSIVGLSNLETDNLVVNGTLVTASAIELNYTDINTLGVAQPNKALVVDADRNITNINSLEAQHITVSGTLVTASALELNTTDVANFGTAEPSKALIVDANKDIGSIRNLSATNLTGTLQTAAQPNVTSVGTLTSLAVAGNTSVGSLTVAGVPLNAFNTGGLKMRAYSNPDFSGTTVKADVVSTVNFANYSPVDGVTENYSMEIWGYIQAIYSEDYTFSVTSNDNFRLWIDGELVRTAWDGGDHANLQTNPIPFVAGKWYSVYMQHVQLTGTESLALSWSSTSQVSQLVPGVSMAYDDKQMQVSSRKRYVQDQFVIYDGVNSTQSKISVSSAGDLAINASSSNVNIVGHDGVTKGLQLAGVLVTATATQINYTNTTPGNAQVSKALVLDSSRNIANVNNVTTTGSLGINTAAPEKQLDVNSATGDCLRLIYDGSANLADLSVTSTGGLVINSSSNTTSISNTNNFDVQAHDGSTLGLKLAGVLVTSTATQINYTNTTPGTAQASKALVVDASKDIAGVHNITGVNSITTSALEASTLQTDTLNTAGNVGINTSSLVFGLQVSHATGNALRLTYNDATGDSPASHVDFVVDGSNNLQLASTGSVDIQSHDGSKGLKLAGVLVTSTAAQLNYTTTTPGSAQASKALVVDANKDISGVNSLNATQLTGTLQTAAQPNVTSLGILTGLTSNGVVDVAEHDGSTLGLKLAGVFVTSTAAQLNYTTTTPGAVDASKAIVVDANKDTAGVRNIFTTGQLGVNTSAPSKQVEINSTTGDCLRLTNNDSDGGAANYGDITVSSVGEMMLASSGEGVIVAAGNSLDIKGHNGTSKGLKLAGVLVTATANQINYTNTTPGTAEASKALVLDENLDSTGINSLTVNSLATGSVSITGTTQSTSPATGSLTLLGGLGVAKNLFVGQQLNVAGDVTFQANCSVVGPALVIPVGNTAARPDGAAGQIRYNSETSQFEGFGAGNTWGSLGGVTDVNQDTRILAETSAGANDDNLRFFNFGTETMRLTKLNLMGLGTDAPAKKLDINSATGDCLRLIYNDADGTAANYSDFTMSALGNLTITASGGEVKVAAADSFDVVGHDGTAVGLKLAGVLVTATAAEINTLDGITATTVELNLLDGVTATTTELNYVDTTPGTAEASKALVFDADVSIAGINNLSATSLTGTLQTAAQPNVTSIGTLTGLTSNGVVNVADHNGATAGLQLAGALVTSTAAQLNYTNTTPGAVQASKAVVVDASRDISNYNNISTTGRIAINAASASKQLDINSTTGDCLRLLYNGSANLADFTVTDAGVLNIKASGSDVTVDTNNSLDVKSHDGSTVGLKLAGVLVTATATQINYTNTTPGTAQASKAIVLDASKDIAGVHNITGVNSVSTSALTTSTLQTATATTTGNVGINTSSLVFGLQVNHATGNALRLTYNDASGDVPTSHVDFVLDGSNNLQLASTGSVDIQSHDGTSKGLKLAGVLVTATASELNYVDTTPGTAQASKALVVDTNKDITGVNSLTATSLTGTLQTAAQPNVTSVGTLTGLTSNGVVDVAEHDGTTKGLKLAGAFVTSTAEQLNYTTTTPGAAQASKALVLDASKNITGVNSISMNTLALNYDSAVGNTAGTPLVISRTTSATPANGLGVGISFVVENAANSQVELGNANVVASSVTAGSEGAQYVINLMNNGSLTEAMRLDANNLYTTQLYETSDRRVKENFNMVNLQETHDRVMNLKLVDYNYKGQQRTHRGLIAQEVIEVIPAAVDVQARGDIADFHSVSTREVTNHLIGSVQFLSKKLEEAMAKIEELQSIIARQQ